MAYRDWKCPECGFYLSDVPDSSGPQVCPNDSQKLQKVFSSPNFMFKGEGWTPTFHKPGEKDK